MKKILSIRKLVLAAMFAALSCVATMVIQIPSPMNGYVNLGDCIVLMCGWILGPVYGGLAAGFGVMAADMFSGYMHYAIGTFIIKASMAVCAYYIYTALMKITNKRIISSAVSGLVSEIIMVIGYFAYAGLLLGNGLGAAASIPGNIVQGIVGLAAGCFVYEILMKNKKIKASIDSF